MECEIDQNSDNKQEFNFPEIDYIDLPVYNEIKRTCETYWDLSHMIDSTFKIIEDRNEYLVECDGYLKGQLIHFVIRTDENGKWINDGRSVILSDAYRDITEMLDIYNFERIINFILENGDRQTYCNMYNNNPHYSFRRFEVYLNPEIGQANMNCDPRISDFNEIVIRDPDSDPQYYYLHIVRSGDPENEQIHTYQGMEADKVYLLNHHDYDLDIMEVEVRGYINTMKDVIE
jgi:hypothetical protein